MIKFFMWDAFNECVPLEHHIPNGYETFSFSYQLSATSRQISRFSH